MQYQRSDVSHLELFLSLHLYAAVFSYSNTASFIFVIDWNMEDMQNCDKLLLLASLNIEQPAFYP